ncbi:MAG: hypothetical protein ACR5LA_11305 [Wolbachia sp.]
MTLESRNSVSYSDDKKRSTDASEQIQILDSLLLYTHAKSDKYAH